LPKRIRDRSLLVAASRDLLRDEKDRKRVATRLAAVGGDFKSIVMISSRQAAKARDERGRIVDADAWTASGAEDLDTAVRRLMIQIKLERLQAAKRVIERVAGRALGGLGS
jgi:hypothetical protein